MRLVLKCAYRCQEYNRIVGGAENSQHVNHP